MLKLTTDKHEATRGLSATAELLVVAYRRTLLRYTLALWHEPSVVCL